MAYLVVLVLDDIQQCPAVMEAWQQAGASGVTILESSGLQRQRGMRDDLGPLPSLETLLSRQEYHHRTLFTVVSDEDTVERVIRATEDIVGDLSQPYTGILFVVPVVRVVGLPKKRKREA
ncbi:MAG: hypothetical protein GXO37_05910 [Chloroflexi bacterium]|nr:hypothetical protein [Chloroflexota bacterium]